MLKLRDSLCIIKSYELMISAKYYIFPWKNTWYICKYIHKINIY